MTDYSKKTGDELYRLTKHLERAEEDMTTSAEARRVAGDMLDKVLDERERRMRATIKAMQA